MQPYIFPYLGYYQLVYCSDVFVLYDDATFIKQGYINRNRILANGQPQRFSLPVPGASSNELIKNLTFAAQTTKFLKTIKQAYSKAPFFNDVFPLVERVIESDDRRIPYMCFRGISEVFQHLGIQKKIILASEIDYDRNASAEDKLIQICRALGSTNYVNSIGGTELYSHESFASKGCNLWFIQMRDIMYDQGTREFVPNLSIIDVLMWCDRKRVRHLLEEFQLLRPASHTRTGVGQPL